MRVIFLSLCLALSSTTLLHAASATYKYDTSGKLIAIEYDDGTKITYLYDNQGNMISSTSTKVDPKNLAWLPAVLDLILED
ncbi:RHS repeat domain-containing protein [Acinetobacter dispersus]|uniref:RHS repeat domain-containing protein n=1 Tax=Acinetobacter dispersus TaxID=70348 RepID=UPI00132F4CF9|nr:RHS repeat domain-containing protein [Acinetobacter dispersus]QHH96409.1 RHS repeat protein [Acinetobacter dispersus]